jgi:cytochrome c-type biogenesis protein CcmH/NrfF
MADQVIRFARALLLVAAAGAAGAAQPPPEAAQKQRIRKLEESLLAPCCWAEPVSAHRSEVALQMRLEIARFVAEGKTDQEIRDHYKRLYGARVLIEPEGPARWWVHVIPVAAFGGGLLLVVWLIRRMARPAPSC